jgi:hypothetical protein
MNWRYCGNYGCKFRLNLIYPFGFLRCHWLLRIILMLPNGRRIGSYLIEIIGSHCTVYLDKIWFDNAAETLVVAQQSIRMFRDVLKIGPVLILDGKGVLAVPTDFTCSPIGCREKTLDLNRKLPFFVTPNLQSIPGFMLLGFYACRNKLSSFVDFLLITLI